MKNLVFSVAALQFFTMATFASESPCVDRPVAETFRESRVVVVGKVVARIPADADGNPAPASEAVRGLYRVEVVEEFKGEDSSEYEMLAGLPLPPPPPGRVYVHEPFLLKIGEKYLLFGWGDPLVVDPCSSLSYDRAADSLGEVRKAQRARQP